MKMLTKFKNTVNNAKKSYKEAYDDWSSEMKDKIVNLIIDSGKDGDAEDVK